jgi:hypothetical protein
MGDTVWVNRRVRAKDVLWLAAREKDLSRQGILDALTESPYSLPKPAEGYLSDVMNFKRPLPDTTLGAALLHLLDTTLEDLHLDPSEYQSVWALLEYARANGWPQHDGHGSGPNGGEHDERVNRTSSRSNALAGHALLAGAGIAAGAASNAA